MPDAAQAADDLVDELTNAPGGGRARQVARIRYTHADMIDQLITNPWISQNELAARYGYSAGWVSIVINSDAFQAALAARREEVVNPEMKMTLRENFHALTSQSLQRLREELAKPACKPEVMLKAAELGAKSLGLGGHAPPPAPPADRLDVLAQRLLALRDRSNHEPFPELIHGEAQRVPQYEDA